MKKSGPWNTRRVAVTAVFLISVVYGLDELLTGDPADPSSEAAIAPAKAVAAASRAASAAPVEQETLPDAESGFRPSEQLVREADAWKARGWTSADPFSGTSWAGRPDVVNEEAAPAEEDTVLRATSQADGVWRAVIGRRVVRVGDPYLGGRVVWISNGRVTVRGADWERVLRFNEE